VDRFPQKSSFIGSPARIAVRSVAGRRGAYITHVSRRRTAAPTREFGNDTISVLVLLLLVYGYRKRAFYAPHLPRCGNLIHGEFCPDIRKFFPKLATPCVRSENGHLRQTHGWVPPANCAGQKPAHRPKYGAGTVVWEKFPILSGKLTLVSRSVSSSYSPQGIYWGIEFI